MAIIASGQITLLDLNDTVAQVNPPSSPVDGMLWFNTENKQLYVFKDRQWFLSSDIQIGGRNLVKLSDVYINGTGGITTATNVSKKGLSLVTDRLIPNQQITVSVDLELVNALSDTSITSTTRRVGGEFSITFKDGTKKYYGAWMTLTTTATSYKGRIQQTYTIENKEIESIYNFGIHIQGLTSGTAKVGRPMVELGNKPTEWTPAIEDINAQFSNLESSITQTASSIRAEVDNKIDNAKSSMEITAEGIATRVTGQAIDGLQIGGRNLVKLSDVYINGTGGITTATYVFEKDLSLVTDRLIPNQKITVSVDVELVNALSDTSITSTSRRVGGEFSIKFKDGTTKYYGAWKALTTTATDYKGRIQQTYAIDNKEIESISGFGIYIQGLTSGTAKVGRPMVELGDKATDWTPAPEDVEQVIDTINVDVENVKEQVTEDAIIQTVLGHENFQNVIDKKVDNDVLGDYATNDAVDIKISEIDHDTIIKDKVKELVEDENSELNQVFTTKSELIQTINSIDFKFSKGSGVNLIKNSVGYADFEFWHSTESMSGISVIENLDLETVGTGSGFHFTPTTELRTLEQDITVVAGETYTLSWMADKSKIVESGNGEFAIKVYDEDGNPVVNSFWYENGDITAGFEQKSLTFEAPTPKITIMLFAYKDVEITITSLMLNVGALPLQWQMANGEIYNTNVKINTNGIKVFNSNYAGYTQITPEEFSGYAEVDGKMERVFTLNKDVTEMSKVKIDNEIAMSSIKVIPITSGGYNGWAWIKDN